MTNISHKIILAGFVILSTSSHIFAVKTAITDSSASAATTSATSSSSSTSATAPAAPAAPTTPVKKYTYPAESPVAGADASDEFEAKAFEPDARYRTCFTPANKCTDMVTDLIKSATKTIHMQAYSFTSKPIAEALEKAADRGVTVKVIFDSRQTGSEHSVDVPLTNTKVQVYIDRPARIAHNKVIIVDGKITVTGSFNYSHGADHGNAENLLAIEDEALASTYLKNWHRRAVVSLKQKMKKPARGTTGPQAALFTSPKSKAESAAAIKSLHSPRFDLPHPAKRKRTDIALPFPSLNDDDASSSQAE